MSMVRARCIGKLAALISTCTLLAGISSAQVSFTSNRFDSTKTLRILAHGDFNNDGREDFFVTQ